METSWIQIKIMIHYALVICSIENETDCLAYQSISDQYSFYQPLYVNSFILAMTFAQ